MMKKGLLVGTFLVLGGALLGWGLNEATTKKYRSLVDGGRVWVPYFLLAIRPEIYNETCVRVYGIFNWQFENQNLWYSRDHPIGLPGIRIELDRERLKLSDEEIENLNGKKVLAEGVFFGGFDSDFPIYNNVLVISSISQTGPPFSDLTDEQKSRMSEPQRKEYIELHGL